MTAIIIKIFFIFGNRKIRQKINAKIVVVWPDGKECHLESKLKISKDVFSKLLYKIGLGLPMICLKIWAVTPLNKIVKKIKILISPNVLIVGFLLLKIFTKHQTKIVGTKKYNESPKWVRVSNNDLVW